MKSSSAGLAFRETMSGAFALGVSDPRTGEEKGKAQGTELSLHAAIQIDDLDRFVADREHSAKLSGRIDFTPYGEEIPGKTGVFNLFSPGGSRGLKLMVYELGFAHGGEEYYLAGRKEVRDDPGIDLWEDTTTLLTRLHRGPDDTYPVVGAGVLSLGVRQLGDLISSMRVIHAESAVEKATALTKFGRFFLGELWETYAGMADQ